MGSWDSSRGWILNYVALFQEREVSAEFHNRYIIFGKCFMLTTSYTLKCSNG